MTQQLGGCCMQYKKISASKSKCGYSGFQDANNKYLSMSSTQAIGGGCGPGCSYNVTIDRKTCAESGDRCGDDMVCCGPTTEVTSDTSKRVYKQYSEDCCCCCDDHENFFDEDTYSLSTLYTKGMLESDVDELKAGVSWDDLEWGQCAFPYWSGSSIDPSIFDCAGGAYVEYYADDETNPSYIQKSWLKFIATGTAYCKVFYPQDGGACTREIVSCTKGEEVEVDPPDELGHAMIFQCCKEDVCEG